MTMSPGKEYRRSRRTQVDHIYLNTGFTGIIIHNYKAVCMRGVSPWLNQFGNYHTSRRGRPGSRLGHPERVVYIFVPFNMSWTVKEKKNTGRSNLQRSNKSVFIS